MVQGESLVETDITNAGINNFNEEHIYNPKYVGWMCVLFFALILGRAVYDKFLFVFVCISLYVFVMSSTRHCISLLFFLLPFSSILKLNVDSISFFTILFFIVVLRMVVENLEIDGNLMMCVWAFFLYNFIFFGFKEMTTILTMIAGMLMLYYIRNDGIDADSVVASFSLGICLSSTLALFKKSLPIINIFVTDAMLKLGENNYAKRFSGLQGNPNYYTLDIIIALSAIIILMYNSKPQKIHTVFMIVLSVFGLMSVSKSFLFVWVFLIVCWFVLSIKQGGGKVVKFVFIVLIGAVVVYCFAYDYINAYFLRFMKDSSGTMASITTGRSHIWTVYLETMFKDFKILFFGNGLNTLLESLGKGMHNTYLQCLYNLGFIGSMILLTSIKVSMGRIITKRVLWIPIILLMIRMFAINILTYDNLWFYLAILVLLSEFCHYSYNQTDE
ncbi:MAG: hypothetical protein ACI4CT_02995 [Lachnospiraceae bacterium]